jgi:hypothetical protein
MSMAALPLPRRQRGCAAAAAVYFSLPSRRGAARQRQFIFYYRRGAARQLPKKENFKNS